LFSLWCLYRAYTLVVGKNVECRLESLTWAIKGKIEMWNVKILCLNLKISWLFYLCMQVFHVTIFFSECRLFQQISTSWVMLLLSGFRNMPFNYISAVDACLWSIMPSYVALVFYSSNWINYVCPKSLYGWTMWCELNIDVYGYTCDVEYFD
jgi:hypothetical protein